MLSKISNNNNYWYLKDHVNSTRVLLDDSNKAVSAYDYDVFGNQLENNVSEESRYRFTGQEYDEETDLHNFKARFYDSMLMRFYSVDPAEEQASPYTYCSNNPVMFVDPTGKTTKCINGYVVAVKYDGTLNLNNNGKNIGSTFQWNSFISQEKGNPTGFINIESNKNEMILHRFEYEVQNKKILLIDYVDNAGNGEKYDVKSDDNYTYGNLPGFIKDNFKNKGMYTGSMLDSKNKIYGTLRDTGNIMAGYITGYNGIDKELTLRAFGGYNSLGNKKGARKITSTIMGMIKNKNNPPYYGEYPQSSTAQSYGWELGHADKKK